MRAGLQDKKNYLEFETKIREIEQKIVGLVDKNENQSNYSILNEDLYMDFFLNNLEINEKALDITSKT